MAYRIIPRPIDYNEQTVLTENRKSDGLSDKLRREVKGSTDHRRTGQHMIAATDKLIDHQLA